MKIRVTANGPLTLDGGIVGNFATISGSSSITGGIAGDLFVANAASVIVSGTPAGADSVIAGTLLVAGGTATVLSTEALATTPCAISSGLRVFSGVADIHSHVAGAVLINDGAVTIHGQAEGHAIALGGALTLHGDLVHTGSGAALAVFGGTVGIAGDVVGNITVKGGDVTIGGTVTGARVIPAGTVKITGTTLAPDVFASTTIALNTLAGGPPTAGTGWEFDGSFLMLDAPATHYTLTGTGAFTYGVVIAEPVTGNLSIHNASITACDYFHGLWISAPGFIVSIKGNNTLGGSMTGEGIFYDAFDGASQPLILDTAAGSTLNAISEFGNFEVLNYGGGICCADASFLVLQGSGTINTRGGNLSHNAGIRIYAVSDSADLIVRNRVTVNAIGGNDSTYSKIQHHGINCANLVIADAAKVNATGGNSIYAFDDANYAGVGVIARGSIAGASVIHVTSTAANALVATSGTDAVGIGTAGILGDNHTDLHFTGTGAIKAIGGIGSVAGNIFLTSVNLAAETRATSLAISAISTANFDFDTMKNFPSAGLITIAGGNVTTKNATATKDDDIFGILNHTAGTYNGTTKGGSTGPGPDTGSSGGGGAPTLPVLVAMLALVAFRARKK